MESNSKNPLLTSTATYGSILGVIIIIYSVILYIFDVMPVGFVKPIVLGLLSIVLYVIGVVVFAKKIRNTYYQNDFPFGTAFLTCFLIALFAGIISTIYSYIHSTLIDPGYYGRIIEAQKEYMINFLSDKGLPEEQLQSTIDKMDEALNTYSPLITALKSFFWNVIISAVLSLIVAAFIKRKSSIFQENA